ncbi:MAG: amidohydrolase [Candidatus Aminicenantes bacterium]|nr:amidohydrolase [Candidatus Aminicenantes bacterium]
MRKRTAALTLFAAIGCLVSEAGQARAQTAGVDKKIEALTAEIAPRLVEICRDIHAHAELSLQETRTAALVAEYWKGLGLEVRTGVGGTGVVGILRGGKPGPVAGMRADMDALPIVEATNLPYASRQKATRDGKEYGTMHACGHDVHTTVMLGVASVLAKMKADLPGTVLFVAQPAEEYGDGAASMLKDGVFREAKPGAMFAFHVDDTAPAGVVKYVPGDALANVDSFRLSVLSEGCHGANPNLCVDPVVVGAQIVLALQVMVSRELSVHRNTVITVGSFHAGSASNIIPPRADLHATVRTYGDDQRRLVREKIERTVANLCEAAGARYEFEYDFGTPSVYNDPGLMKEAVETAARVVGPKNVVQELPDMGGEDFAYFAREVPSALLLLGVQPARATATLHSPFFVADEKAIPVGVRVMAAILWDYLGRRAGK